IVEELTHEEGGAIRRSRLLRVSPFASLDPVGGPEGAALCLGDQFYLGHGRNTGESLSPEAKGGDVGQVLRRAYLARRVAQEGRRNVLHLNAAAVVRHPDKGNPPVPYLHRDG